MSASWCARRLSACRKCSLCKCPSRSSCSICASWRRCSRRKALPLLGKRRVSKQKRNKSTLCRRTQHNNPTPTAANALSRKKAATPPVAASVRPEGCSVGLTQRARTKSHVSESTGSSACSARPKNASGRERSPFRRTNDFAQALPICRKPRPAYFAAFSRKLRSPRCAVRILRRRRLPPTHLPSLGRPWRRHREGDDGDEIKSGAALERDRRTPSAAFHGRRRSQDALPSSSTSPADAYIESRTSSTKAKEKLKRKHTLRESMLPSAAGSREPKRRGAPNSVLHLSDTRHNPSLQSADLYANKPGLAEAKPKKGIFGCVVEAGPTLPRLQAVTRFSPGRPEQSECPALSFVLCF